MLLHVTRNHLAADWHLLGGGSDQSVKLHGLESQSPVDKLVQVASGSQCWVSSPCGIRFLSFLSRPRHHDSWELRVHGRRAGVHVLGGLGKECSLS